MSDRAPDYAQGFKDGFAAGLEEGKKLAPKQTRLDDYVFGQPGTCQVCGRLQSGITGYVCYDNRCPSRITFSNAISGAFGSDEIRTMSSGANGPAGPLDGGLDSGLGKTWY